MREISALGIFVMIGLVLSAIVRRIMQAGSAEGIPLAVTIIGVVVVAASFGVLLSGVRQAMFRRKP